VFIAGRCASEIVSGISSGVSRQAKPIIMPWSPAPCSSRGSLSSPLRVSREWSTPAAISADVRIEREGAATDDAFDVTLHYPRMRALLRASMLAASPGPTFAVHGTRGSFVKYGLDPQEEALKSGRTPDEPNWDAEPPDRHGKLTTPEGTRTIPSIPSSFTHYYENVRDAIQGTAPPAVTTEQMLDVMHGLELALASSRKRCVLPWAASERPSTAPGPNRH